MEENQESLGAFVPERRTKEWKSREINHLATALAKAQSEMKGAVKTSQGYNWKYADLHTVIEASFPYLTKHGLSIIQGCNKDKEAFFVSTRLLHSSGQWTESWIRIPIEKLNAQQIGTATTNGRRYGLAAMAGIAQKDDDGQENKELLAAKEKSEVQTVK